MSILRAIALFTMVAFGGAVIAAGFVTSPASAGKMNGKPGGGRNSAHYDTPSNGTAKPPTSTKK
ncbi:hypothetical protein ABIB66_007825 [Bradyrhizobium sp. F1.13.3]